MKLARTLFLSAPLALATACGGSSMEATGSGAFTAATPAFSEVALDLTPAAAVATLTPPPAAASPAPVADACNPHLFVRSEDVVRRVNRHLFKFLSHVERAITRQPKLTTGSSATWEHRFGDVDVKLTVTRKTDTTFTWTLEMKKASDTAFVAVASGELDRAGAQGPHQGKGAMRLDLDKLAAVTGEEVAGVITAAFEAFADHRLVSAHAAGVVWDTDAKSPIRRAPRDADYVYYRAPGKGGSLKISEEMAFACPANPAISAASVDLVNRWYLTSTGSLHGRSDAQMTGGQLDALKIAKIEALTCHESAVEKGEPAERAWLLKAEDASGATLFGMQSVAGLTACDPALNPPSGAVPSLADNKTDFDFSRIDFTDGKPYPFPGL